MNDFIPQAVQRQIAKRYGVVRVKVCMSYLRWCTSEADAERVMTNLIQTCPELWERCHER